MKPSCDDLFFVHWWVSMSLRTASRIIPNVCVPCVLYILSVSIYPPCTFCVLWLLYFVLCSLSARGCIAIPPVPPPVPPPSPAHYRNLLATGYTLRWSGVLKSSRSLRHCLQRKQKRTTCSSSCRPWLCCVLFLWTLLFWINPWVVANFLLVAN